MMRTGIFIENDPFLVCAEDSKVSKSEDGLI